MSSNLHSRPPAQVTLRRRATQRGALLGVVAVLVAALLAGAGSAAPTQAAWADAEFTGSSFRAGVVSSPPHVECTFERDSFTGLRVNWEPGGSDANFVEPEGYRFDFSAANSSTPQPFSPTTGVVTGSSFTAFGRYLRDPNFNATGLRSNTYAIRLTAVGPGNWESDSWVLQARVSSFRFGRLVFRDSSCTVVEVPENDWGAVTFAEDYAEELSESELEEEMVEDELELLEQESDAEDDDQPEETSAPVEETPPPVEEEPQQPGEPAETDEGEPSETEGPDQPAPSVPDSPTPSEGEPEVPSPDETATETPTETEESPDPETGES